MLCPEFCNELAARRKILFHGELQRVGMSRAKIAKRAGGKEPYFPNLASLAHFARERSEFRVFRVFVVKAISPLPIDDAYFILTWTL